MDIRTVLTAKVKEALAALYEVQKNTKDSKEYKGKQKY